MRSLEALDPLKTFARPDQLPSLRVRSSMPSPSASDPAEIEDRAIPGHWEGDLLSGTSNSHIATLVERHSRFTLLVKVPTKDTATVLAALSRHVRKLPPPLRRSLNWDRGLEMAKAQELHGGYKGECLLLRSPESLAARHKRKHEWTPETILP